MSNFWGAVQFADIPFTYKMKKKKPRRLKYGKKSSKSLDIYDKNVL